MSSPLFCGNCGTLQAGNGLNYFELFGLEPAYELDPAELRRRYLSSARSIHPDRGADAALSLEASARLNEAYRVLSDPLLRAEYLLELVGGKSSAADKSVPQEVLDRTLMLREQIEEARLAGDQPTLATLRGQVGLLVDDVLVAVANLARQLPGTDLIRQELRQQLNTVKYYQRLLEYL